MATIGALVVDLTANTARFQRNMSASKRQLNHFGRNTRTVQQQLDRFNRTARNASRDLRRFATVTGGLATGLAAAGFSLTRLASQAEETQSKFNVVFRGMARETNEWAEEFAGSVGRADRDVKDWMASIQDTFVPLGMARDEAAGLTKELTELAVDVASFNNVADEKVIRDFNSALVGSHRAVQQYGIVLNQTTLMEEVRRMGIRKTWDELDEATKAQARFNLILESTRDAQGDAIRTQDSYQNQMRGLSADARNLGEEFGNRLLQPFSILIGWVRQGIQWFADLDDEMKNNIVRVGFLATAVLGGVTAIALFGSAIAKAVQVLILFAKGMALLASPVVLKLMLITGAAFVLYRAWEQNWLGVRDLVTSVWERYLQPTFDAIRTRLDEAWDWAIDTGGDVWEWLTDTTWVEKIEDVKRLLDGVWDWAIETAKDAWEWLDDGAPWVTNVLEYVYDLLSTVWSWGIETARDAWRWLADTDWVQVIHNVGDALADGWEWMISTDGGAWDWIEGTKLVEFLQEASDKITDSKAWKWTIDLAEKTGEMVLDVVVKASGDMYEAIQHGLETGEWGPFWGVTSDIWSAGVRMGVTFYAVAATVAKVLAAFTAGLGATTAGLGAFGIPGIVAAISVGVAFKAAETTAEYKELARNLIAGLIAGLAVGGLLASPQAGMLTFVIAFEFEIGSKIREGLDWLQKEIDKGIESVTGAEGHEDLGQRVYDFLFGDRPEPPETPGGGGGLREEPIGAVEPQRPVLPAEPVDTGTLAQQIESAIGHAGIGDVIEAISVAEGVAAGESTWEAVMQGFVAQADSEHPYGRFSSSVNQQLFEDVLEQTGFKEGSEEYYKAAAGVSAQFYWRTFQREFEQHAGQAFAEMGEEVRRLFAHHMGSGFAPTEGEGLRPAEIEKNPNWPGHMFRSWQTGTPWTGSGARDEFAGFVHHQEAVIPTPVLKRGAAAVLEFLGMGGHMSGLQPPSSVTGDEGGMPDWIGQLANTVGEQVSAGLEKLLGEERFEMLTTGFDTVKDEVQTLMDSFDYIQQEVEELTTGAEKVEPDPVPWAEYGRSLVDTLTTGMMEQLPLLRSTLETFREAVQQGATPLQALASSVLHLMMQSEGFRQMMEVLGQVVQTVADILGTVFGGVARAVAAVWNALIELISLIPFVNLRRYRIELDDATETTKEYTEAVREATYNVPRGFRIQQRRAEAGGDFVPAGGGDTQLPSWVPENLSDIIVNIYGDNYDDAEMTRKIKQAVAEGKTKTSLAKYGRTV